MPRGRRILYNALDGAWQVRRNARHHRRAVLWLPWPRPCERSACPLLGTTRFHLYACYPCRYRWKSDLQQGAPDLVRALPFRPRKWRRPQMTVRMTMSRSDRRCNLNSSSKRSLNCVLARRPQLAFLRSSRRALACPGFSLLQSCGKPANYCDFRRRLLSVEIAKLLKSMTNPISTIPIILGVSIDFVRR